MTSNLVRGNIVFNPTTISMMGYVRPLLLVPSTNPVEMINKENRNLVNAFHESFNSRIRYS